MEELLTVSVNCRSTSPWRRCSSTSGAPRRASPPRAPSSGSRSSGTTSSKRKMYVYIYICNHKPLLSQFHFSNN
uniref:Uncharacterized protein n=1 Tax=Aegilops tauschii subsp. strangulata TaxID=200361 RepID=A0A453JBE7_AEGTS